MRLSHLFLLILAGVAPVFAAAASIRPVDLRCEYRSNPQGIDEVQPRLTWALAATDRSAHNLKQSAYRVMVASTKEALAAGKSDLWDSGRIDGDHSVLLPYRGKNLDSGMRAYWRVQVWDQAGVVSPWSETAEWSMGLLDPGAWKAKWIGLDETSPYQHPGSPFQLLKSAKWIWLNQGDPAKQASAGAAWFKTTLTIPEGRTIRHATFVLGADDRFEVKINGARAGRGSSPSMPEVLDVATALKFGSNVIEVEARNERPSPAGLIGTLKIEFTTGDPIVMSTSSQWQVATAANGNWTGAKEIGPFGMEPWGQVGLVEERALPARMLRKDFTVKPSLKRATVYFSGLGLSELEVNGAKIGDAVLSPALTEYEKRVFYVTHDITRQLNAGKNAVGVLLGNGRYWAPRGRVPIGSRGFGYPKLLLHLDLEYANGNRETIVSDESWKLTADGPIRVNNEYDGEEFDAQRMPAGWSRSGFDDSKWQQARVVQGPPGAIVAQMAEPLKVIETLTPKSLKQIRPGVWIFDMGQNMVGWARLSVTGPKGTPVTLRFAETLKPDGALYLDNLRSARATDIYTLGGSGNEVWEPRFTYHGFRFVELTGYPGMPTLRSLEGRVVHDDMEKAGEWESSDAMLNRIHRNIYWGVRGNYRSIPTDCPQRDERQGWLGDRSVVSRSESYLFNVAAFYSKWMTDLKDSQRDSGSIPDVSPAYWVLYNDGIVWPSTFLLAPAMVYEQYGDSRVIERNYPAMRKWAEYMRGFLKDGIMPKNTYGDWCVPPEKPELIHSQDPARVTQGALLSTAYYYRMLQLLSRYAKLIDKHNDAAGYDSLAAQVRGAFLKKYFRAQEAKFDNGTQTSSVLPLALGLVPEQDRTRVFDSLVNKIQGESNNHVGVGLVGAQWLMRTLSENGRADLAFTIATQKTYPGWGYMVEKGATTVWELWNGDTADPAMNSGNHVMQIGDMGVWMYEYLAGIKTDPEQPGFKHIIIKPYTPSPLTYVKASHKSPYGVITSGWKRDASKLTLNVEIPPNTTATVYVPSKNATGSAGAKSSRSEGNTSVFEIGSGVYTFNAQ